MLRLSSSGKKGQWYLVSAVMVSGAFLVISALFKNYYIVDTSQIAMMNEDYYFWDLRSAFEKTIEDAGFDQPGCTNLNRRLDEFMVFSQKSMAEKGYYLFMNKSIDCANEKVEYGMLIASGKSMLYYNVKPEEVIYT